MMDFLRALAPSHAAAKTRAVPVVRSRFEDGRPLSQVPAVQVDTLTQGVAADQRETPGPERAITRLVESAREGEAVLASRTDRSLVARSERRIEPSQMSEQLPVRSTSQPLPARAVPATRDTARQTEPVREVSRAIEAPARVRAAQTITAPLQTAAVPVVVTMPDTAGSPPARGPLSSGAVAARTESRSESRPIIHVTIDRIDVRAPSVPERASSRPRSRSNASASLNDYLRSRQPSRSGGTS